MLIPGFRVIQCDKHLNISREVTGRRNLAINVSIPHDRVMEHLLNGNDGWIPPLEILEFPLIIFYRTRHQSPKRGGNCDIRVKHGSLLVIVLYYYLLASDLTH